MVDARPNAVEAVETRRIGQNFNPSLPVSSGQDIVDTQQRSIDLSQLQARTGNREIIRTTKPFAYPRQVARWPTIASKYFVTILKHKTAQNPWRHLQKIVTHGIEAVGKNDRRDRIDRCRIASGATRLLPTLKIPHRLTLPHRVTARRQAIESIEAVHIGCLSGHHLAVDIDQLDHDPAEPALARTPNTILVEILVYLTGDRTRQSLAKIVANSDLSTEKSYRFNSGSIDRRALSNPSDRPCLRSTIDQPNRLRFDKRINPFG